MPSVPKPPHLTTQAFLEHLARTHLPPGAHLLELTSTGGGNRYGVLVTIFQHGKKTRLRACATLQYPEGEGDILLMEWSGLREH